MSEGGGSERQRARDTLRPFDELRDRKAQGAQGGGSERQRAKEGSEGREGTSESEGSPPAS